jgi:hypothetical protein
VAFGSSRVVLQELLVGLILGGLPAVVGVSIPGLVASARVLLLLWRHEHLVLVGVKLVPPEED